MRTDRITGVLMRDLPKGTMPFGLKIDARGNLYASDFKGARILRITPINRSRPVRTTTKARDSTGLTISVSTAQAICSLPIRRGRRWRIRPARFTAIRRMGD